MADHQHADGGDALPGQPVCRPVPGGRQEDEFRAFYMAEVPRLVSMLVALGASLDQAADLAQETMIITFRRWAEVRNPHAWVREVATHELYAHWRRSLRDSRNTDILDEEVHEGQLLLRSPSPIEEWITRYAVLDALARLPPRQREVMVLSLEGHNPAEIADILGIDPQAVRASLLKARRKLKGYLSGEAEQ